MEGNIVLIYRKLKAIEDGVEADAPFDGFIGFLLELLQQLMLVKIMEGVHDFIGKANKAIQVVYGHTQIRVQQLDGAAKRRAVLLSGYFTAQLAYLIEKMHHLFA